MHPVSQSPRLSSWRAKYWHVIRHPRMITCFIAALLAGISLAADAPPVPPRTWPDTKAAVELLKALPVSDTECSLAQDPQSYTSQTLREHIPDQAESILAYDFRWAVSALYKPAGNDGTITIDAFMFGSDLDAFGAFAQGRSLSTPAALLQNASYWAGTQLHIWRGPLYVRVMPSSRAEKIKAPCEKLAVALFAALPEPTPQPLQLTLLPVGAMLQSTVKFARRDVLGQEALRNGITATYSESLPPIRLPGVRPTSLDMPRQANIQLVMLEGADEAQGQQLYDDLRRTLVGESRISAVPFLGDEAHYAKTERYGRVLLMRVRSYAAAVTGFDQNRTAESLLRLLGSDIRIMLNARPLSP